MSAELPDNDTLFRVIDATWPAATLRRAGPWTIREGLGGGSRVSAATAEGPVGPDDIPAAEEAMRALSQVPLFMIRDKDAALDEVLAARGYALRDPVTIWTAPLSALARPRLEPGLAYATWPTLAAMRDIWAAGDVGPERLAVMERATGPKAAILGRAGDNPAGVAFVGISDGVAMLHALHVDEAHRRRGVARLVMQGAVQWASDAGARSLALLVTRANTAANALYASLGMTPAGQYHYRKWGMQEPTGE